MYFCGSLEKLQKSKKLEPTKIFCHTRLFLLFVHYELFNMDTIIIACDVSTGLILFGTVASCVDQPKKF